MEALDSMRQCFHAAGSDRNTQAGRSIKLVGHFSSEPPRMALAERDYVILALDHRASNNYQTGPAAASTTKTRLPACARACAGGPARSMSS